MNGYTQVWSNYCNGPDQSREDGVVVVRVYLDNDEGDKIVLYATGYTTDGAVENAEHWANSVWSRSGGTYTMSEWEAV